MTFPTTCTTCGFGQEHICERSVCPCVCHEDDYVPKVQVPDSPYVVAAVQTTMRELDTPEETYQYAMGD